MAPEAAYLFGAFHASRGQQRLAAAIFVQLATGLRPSELLGLTTDHVFVPLNLRQFINIRLGVAVSTKIKREQFVQVNPLEQPLAYKLIRLLCAATVEGGKLFNFSYSAYNNSFAEAERHFGLDLHLTAHSGRSGFATGQIMKGVDPKVVQAAGRWLSESSFKTYIDTAGSLHVRTQISFNNLLGAATWCKQHIEEYFVGLSCLDGEAQSSRLSRKNESARPPAEGESFPSASTSRAPQRIPETQMEGGAARHVANSVNSDGIRQRQRSGRGTSSGKGQSGSSAKGRGRGKLLPPGRAPQSVFE